MTMKVWHCKEARSLRPLWALEEMGLDYEVEMLPFPPRFFQQEYLEVNPLGTVPYFTDGDVAMTESTAICHYLVDKYDPSLGVEVKHPEYAAYLNWLYQSDATFTFPQTLFFRYAQLEPEERRQPVVAEDYRRWFFARLRRLDQHLLDHEYLCDGRFTIADIAVGYALYLAVVLGISEDFAPQTQSYYDRLSSRSAFIKVDQLR